MCCAKQLGRPSPYREQNVQRFPLPKDAKPTEKYQVLGFKRVLLLENEL